MKSLAKFFGAKEFPFYLYDKRGNEVYQEIHPGMWFRNIYDSNNHMVERIHSNGVRWRWKYDKNGNPTNTETFNPKTKKGWEWFSEFDYLGNEIYREYSDGGWHRWEWDDENRLVHYEDSYKYDTKPTV